MLKYISRRIGISILVLLAGSVLLFVLTINSGDPIADLRESNDRNKENRIRLRTEAMGLDRPWYERYWDWLSGVSRCFIGQCDFGKNSKGTSVNVELVNAASSTLRLVIAATILALVVGVILGIATAVRQYSGFDYAVTFMAFVFFSLPIFWAAVMLKDYAAIRFNNWLVSPTISPQFQITTAIVLALIMQLALGGSWKRRLATAGFVFAFVMVVLYYFETVDWFRQPSVGLPVFIITGLATAVLLIGITVGFENAGVRNTLLGTLVVGTLIYALLRNTLLEEPSWLNLLFCFVIAFIVAIISAEVLGQYSKKTARGLSITLATVMSVIALADLSLSNWASYLSINSRPIPTIGEVTPNLNGDFWQDFLDKGSHLILPTLVLTLGGIAGYIRYTRASMLEVLNQDYIRTARSKGLPERLVITKHAFRNALIPITTIVAFDFAGLIGGAVITETVFGWKGMGALFKSGLDAVDPAPVMAFFAVTGTAAILMNLAADIAYAYLDPRITR